MYDELLQLQYVNDENKWRIMIIDQRLILQDVPYKTLLLSISDNAATVVKEMLDKYGINRSEFLGLQNFENNVISLKELIVIF